MTTFSIGEHDFLLDGEPHRVLAGAIHYFRVHPDHWAHRISMARAMGLNAIETYVPWNEHSPHEGEFRTDGMLDLGAFLDAVQAAGMHAIVRPGPFICAEWDGGGFPGWLFRDPSVGVRRSDARYLAAADEYLRNVYSVVAPRQIDSGGSVILVQIENEYGAYGNDKAYLAHLVDVTREAGITVPLTTVDQPTDQMLADGSLPGIHLTGSFGSRVTERLATLRANQPTGPLVCMEFWDGWFDWWGAHHHTTSPAEAAANLDELLAAGASVNVYMFHGGTNFGLTNGANDKGVYQPIVTSYDYDAPLDESGRPTAKFWAMRDVIARYAPVPDDVPEDEPFGRPHEASFDASAPLWRMIDDHATTVAGSAPSVDDVGIYRGFVVYGAHLPERVCPSVLSIGEVRDRAQVFVDGVALGVIARENHETALVLPAGPAGTLTLLVEDQGRVNYESRIGEHKGLIGGVWLDGSELLGWSIQPVDLDRLAAAPLGDDIVAYGPMVAQASFTGLDAGRDLFVDTAGWGKGLVWVNGFLLGRYWSRGPQHTLYVPGALIPDGVATVRVLELHAVQRPTVRLVSAPDLGHTQL